MRTMRNDNLSKMWLQWGHNFTVVEIWQNDGDKGISVEGFNGATTLQLWKFDVHRGKLTNLQASMGPQLYSCGNKFTASSQHGYKRASMGPQLYSCGNCVQRKRGLNKFIRFNGATTLQLWKLSVRQVLEYARKYASMGPQLYSCGNNRYHT